MSLCIKAGLLLTSALVGSGEPTRIEDFRLDLTPAETADGQALQTRAIASQAYVYQLPAFFHLRQLREFIQGREYTSPEETPLGGWILVRDLSTPKTANTMPYVDTLCGASYLLLEKQGPVVLTVPEITDRYYAVVLHSPASRFSANWPSNGRRTSTCEPGGAAWKSVTAGCEPPSRRG
jgi:hypothetical protein